jgi:hypothetical protein
LRHMATVFAKPGSASVPIPKSGECKWLKRMAPQVGLEDTVKRSFNSLESVERHKELRKYIVVRGNCRNCRKEFFYESMKETRLREPIEAFPQFDKAKAPGHLFRCYGAIFFGTQRTDPKGCTPKQKKKPHPHRSRRTGTGEAKEEHNTQHTGGATQKFLRSACLMNAVYALLSLKCHPAQLHDQRQSSGRKLLRSALLRQESAKDAIQGICC